MLIAMIHLSGFSIKTGGLNIKTTKTIARSKIRNPPLSSNEGKIRIPNVQKERKSPSTCHGRKHPKLSKTNPMVKDVFIEADIEYPSGYCSMPNIIICTQLLIW